MIENWNSTRIASILHNVNEPVINPTLRPEHFETVLDAVPEAVLTLDRGFVITSFNRAAERLTGFLRAEVIGRHCSEVFRSRACRTADNCPMELSLRLGATSSTRDLTILNRDNEEVLVHITFNALQDFEGHVIGGVETFHAVEPAAMLKVRSAPTNGLLPSGSDDLPILEASERSAILTVLDRHNWNKTAASRELGISRITLWRKMRKLRIMQ